MKKKSEGSGPPQAPVFRELYSEKRVVAEERRLRVDDSPMGAFQEAFSAAAFANNYGRPVIGWPSDFARLGRREVHRPDERRSTGPRPWPQTGSDAQAMRLETICRCRVAQFGLLQGCA